MKHLLKTFFFCLITTLPVMGQKNISLIGTLVEPENNSIPVEYATVRLLSLPDSAFVSGTTTGKTGAFTIKNLSKGNYLVHASYVGYGDLYKKVVVSGSNTSVNLGILPFELKGVMLKEAVVTAKANEVVVKKDTIEYNAASYKTEENAVVEDLLKKLPGVEVDSEGKITVGGKEIKKILVDGKEFFSDDPKVASKNLPVNMIEKLQVLDQKSDMAKLTGFEDGEEQTVINLTIKPGMKKGTVGNVAAGIGHDVESGGDLRYEITGMVNQMNNSDRYTLMFSGNNTNNMGASDLGGSRFGGMRGMRRGGSAGINTSEMLAFNLNKDFSKKLTLNGDINYNGSDRDVKRVTNRTTNYMNRRDGSMQSLIERTASSVNDVSDNLGINMRLEWKPNENNTFIFRPNFSYNKSSSRENQDFLSMNGLNGDTISKGPSHSYNEGSGYGFGGTFEYAHQFNKAGRVFSVSLTGNYRDSYSQETYSWERLNYEDGIYMSDRDTSVVQRSENDDDTKSFRFYTSYVEPLGRNYFLQFAYRISRSDTKSINSTYDLEMGGTGAIGRDTATLNPSQSRSTIRRSIEQRFSLNFKSMREKYNYTIGLNIDPTVSTNKTVQPYISDQTTVITEFLPESFHDRLPNISGDSLISNIERNVVNFSPNINFNYNFGERTNLRVDYSGTTTQPTANQLRDYTDYSNPQNLVTGNPNLDPGYQNELSVRFDKFIPATQLFYNFRLRGNLSMNDVGSKVFIDSTGVRNTTYANINGNWDINFLGMFNTPLKNKKFSISNFLNLSYRNQRGYTNDVLNTMRTFSLRDRVRLNYRSDLFDVGTSVSLTYSNSINEIQPDKNQRTYDMDVMGYTTWYLPHKFSIGTDITWGGKRGYSDGFNKDETIWNASVTKQLFSKKVGTGSLRLKIYDILQDRKSISRSVGTDYIQDTESNILQSFFMCSFIYRFNIFPSGSSAKKEDFEPSREQRYRERGGGGGGRYRDRSF